MTELQQELSRKKLSDKGKKPGLTDRLPQAFEKDGLNQEETEFELHDDLDEAFLKEFQPFTKELESFTKGLRETFELMLKISDEIEISKVSDGNLFV